MSIELLKGILKNPIPYAHALGYTKLNQELHGLWIQNMLKQRADGTLQAHRGAYKTSCLIVAITLWTITKPTENIIFLRKSQEDVKEVLSSVSKALQHSATMHIAKGVYGRFPKLITESSTELELDTYRGTMGRQVLGLGLKASITGKHGSVFTDDIVTIKDRISKAERDTTKNQYMELLNIASEEEHRIFNTGTPWHKDDAFSVMPAPVQHNCYQTGILSKERLQEKKDGMTRALFAANYELKHVADEDALFKEPAYGDFPIGARAWAHIDAAYGGPDSNALTIIAEVDKKLHTIGWKWEGHIEKHYKKICQKFEEYQVIGCCLEDNADKGFLKRELKKMTNTQIFGYHESTNKYYKISTYGKMRWKDVIYDSENGDLEYISAILDYNENAEHDDCPDSYASLVRWKYKAQRKMKAGGVK